MRAPIEIIEDVPQVLSRIAYFRVMPRETLRRLGENSHVITLRKGDVLVAKGATDVRHVYAVLDGQIHVGLPSSDSIRSVHFIESGMTLGESILLSRTEPPYQAVATRKSRILALDGDRWLKEIQSAPGLAWEVLKHMAQRRLGAMHTLAVSSRRTDLSRVAGFIMGYQPKLHSECFSFELPARKLDIAANLGMTNSSFSRALQYLKQNVIIEVRGSFIRVLKVALLEQAAQGRRE